MERGKIGRQRSEPRLLELARPGIDEERGTDFHDDAAEVAEGWRFGHDPAVVVLAQAVLAWGIRRVRGDLVCDRPAMPLRKRDIDVGTAQATPVARAQIPNAIRNQSAPGARHI